MNVERSLRSNLGETESGQIFDSLAVTEAIDNVADKMISGSQEQILAGLAKIGSSAEQTREALAIMEKFHKEAKSLADEAKETVVEIREAEPVEYKFVKDYQVESNVASDYYNGEGQHELLGLAVGKLVKKIKDGGYTDIVLLDTSARPLTTMIRKMLPYHFDKDGRLVDQEIDADVRVRTNFINPTILTTALRKYFDNQENRHAVIESMKLERQAEKDKYREKRDHSKIDYLERAIINVTDGGYFGPEFENDPYYQCLMSFLKPELIREIIGSDVFDDFASANQAIRAGGKVLVIDEYSNTEHSLRLAQKIFEIAAALNGKDKMKVDIHALSNQSFDLFKLSDGSMNPPWRYAKYANPDIEPGISGVIKSNQEIFASRSGAKMGDVNQLRREMRGIADEYLERQKDQFVFDEEYKEDIESYVKDLQAALVAERSYNSNEIESKVKKIMGKFKSMTREQKLVELEERNNWDI